MRIRSAIVLGAVALMSCPKNTPVMPPPPSGRCEVDVLATGLFGTTGTGSSAKVVASAADLIGGQFAQGMVGDTLIQNDKIRVIIQRAVRSIGPMPYGGVPIDADVQRGAGVAGQDQMGKLGLIYAFGRTVNAQKVEVLADGSKGGPAIVAATGTDTVNDYVNIANFIGTALPGATFALDPNTALPFTITTYYVLSPGESRLRMMSAFCNTGSATVSMQVGDLFEQGGTTDFFNPKSCTKEMGSTPCLIDPDPWYGYQGDAEAYGVRSYAPAKPIRADPNNVVIGVNGLLSVTSSGSQDETGILTWVDATATARPGAFEVAPSKPSSYLRDLFVGKDLADVSSSMLAIDAVTRARVNVTLDDPKGAPFAGRIAVVDANGLQVTLMQSGTDGTAQVDLPPGTYSLYAGALGYAVAPPVSVTVPSTGSVTATLALGATRKIAVNVADPFGAAIPAKVTVLCPSGTCMTQQAAFKRFYDIEDLPSNVARIAYVPPSGALSLDLPQDAYQVFVSRGPEYSIYPADYFTAPAPADSPDTINAVLAHVVDTTGWMSADLHVHGVYSGDSSVRTDDRVLEYEAEGIDVLVSTDHDYVTDYAPVVQGLGAQSLIATMSGCEITPFDFGHQQVYPYPATDALQGGAFDWAGGEGPTLRLDEIYSGVRAVQANGVVQMNHPHRKNGSLTLLQVDTLTGATHVPADHFRMVAPQGATDADTKLFSPDFDAFEVLNGAVPDFGPFNDWMVFLSRGLIATGTAVSDSHHLFTDQGGYSRTYVNLGFDDPAHFTPDALTAAVKAHHVVGGNGPFIAMGAQLVDAADAGIGPKMNVGETLLGLDPAAGQSVRLTVDVQAPEWFDVDTIEIYTYAPGRESVKGVANNDWPASRILQSRTLDPMTHLEAVPGQNGGTFRRVHFNETFTVTPTADAWYVAFARGGASAKTLTPMVWSTVSCTAGVCTPGAPVPFSYTNPIFVDGDKSGAYDDFPLKPPGPPPPPGPRHHGGPEHAVVPTVSALRELIREMKSED